MTPINDNDLAPYAAFIAADTGCAGGQAHALAAFMLAMRAIQFVGNPHQWVKHGRARVYFDPWSQNKRPALEFAERIFFCADARDVFVDLTFGDRLRIDEVPPQALAFSGARTRAAFDEFRERLRWLRDYLAQTY